ncbi:MAG: LysM peptidoglycan-binding domain-containing protein [Candidatus Aureabacteria bacterium]|nr:LysM peptidoglycan-binding domain-containing protein [Candidatus Auribacterota bacterium]
MKTRKTVVCISGVFLLMWFLCAVWIIQSQAAFSPVYRTSWTLRVVKVVDHIVKKGESLTKIANTYGVTLQDILRANSITNPDSVKPGEKIKIPLKKVKGEVLI